MPYKDTLVFGSKPLPVLVIVCTKHSCCFHSVPHDWGCGTCHPGPMMSPVLGVLLAVKSEELVPAWVRVVTVLGCVTRGTVV